MVEVFRTNVSEEKDALRLLEQLLVANAHSKINFDLEDCDKVLRIESNEIIDFRKVILIFKNYGFQVDILLD